MKFGPGVIFGISAIAIVVLLSFMFWNGGDNLGKGEGETLLLYCAQGVQKPMEKIIAEYEELTGVTIVTQYSGSGTLLSTIDAAKDGDIYLAADISYCQDARHEGTVEEILKIAFQRPVLAVPAGNPKNIRSIDDLIARKDELRISLADPKAAAISRVAKKILETEGKWAPLWDSLLVSRSTVEEVALDISTGTCDVGIVWNATVVQHDKIAVVEDSLLSSEEKTIAMGVLSASKKPTRALHFARFIAAKDKGLLHFDTFGYDPIEGDAWANKPELIIYSGGLNRLAVQDTIHAFEKREGVTVLTDFNGCGILVGQMETGVDPDMYFSCDTSFMDMVEEKFLPPINLSSTDMVIITSKKGKYGEITLADLTQEEIKVGITNPEHSALGALSQILLEKNGLWEEVQPFADTPATADVLVNQVELGALDAAIVYRANTTRSDELVVSTIDDPAASAIQPIAIGISCEYPHLVERLISQIRQTEEHFKELGYEWVDDASAEVLPD